MNAGVAGFNYSVDDSTPIEITVTGGQFGANAYGDFYTFTVDGQAVNIGNGDFKFMRGKTYRFVSGGISGHPFKVYHNNSFVTASNGGNSISSTGHSITVNILPNHPFPVTANMLYYQCGQHPSMQANLALSMLDVGGMAYDFFYGTIEVAISGTFASSVGFRNLAGTVTSADGLSYSTTCQVSNANGVSEINVTIDSGHGTGAGDLYYVHQSEGNVNMSLTAIDVGGGVIVDHFYGNIDVVVNANFGDASVRNLDGNFIGGTNLITYGQSENIGDTGVSSIDINIPTSANNQNNLYYKTFQSGSEIQHRPKIYFLYKSVGTQSYDFYYGKIHVNVNGNFGDMSVYCYYHGYMGGENLLTYTDKCDVNLRGTANGFGPATLIVKSFNNTGVRTVELIKKLGEDTVLTFKNPEAHIFEPVGCGTISA